MNLGVDAALQFKDGVLWLCQQADRVSAQLINGAKLARDQAGPLRNDISTDEISPLTAMVHFDATLGRFAYTGFTAEAQRPIGIDAIRTAGVEVVVAGRRYGKGSSREHSVVAERSAGIRLVIAESFERIYRQNADNLGLWTSTDFSLVDRIQRGESITVRELLVGRDALAADILCAGGLLAYGRKFKAAPSVPLARAASDMSRRQAGPAPASSPQNLFEKIITLHLAAPASEGLPMLNQPLQPGAGGFVRADWRFIHEYYSGMCAWMLEQEFGAATRLHEPDRILTFEDHLSYVHASPAHVSQGLVGQVAELSRSHRAFVARFGLRDHGYVQNLPAGDAGNQGSLGISHAMMTERYALPGQVVVGTDSHTTHSGALGCVAFGVGTTDIANAFVTGSVRLTMPQVLRIELGGQLAPGVTAKDVALYLLARDWIRQGQGVGCVFEFAGSVVRGLSIDERATLTNMAAEMGAFAGLVEPDARTVEFVQERRGLACVVAPWMCSDAGASYAAIHRFDCSALTPMVARPGDPGQALRLADLDAPVRVHLAYGGSCTAGKREDFDHYYRVLAWAAAHGLRVATGVQLYLQFGTQDVLAYCQRQGYLRTFAEVGAQLLQPACGACANCGPGASSSSEQVTVSAINRNFPGRSGPGQVWLASAPTVAASAIAGRLISFADLQRECPIP